MRNNLENNLNGIGKIILWERKRVGVSREKLAEGICSQGFLKRVESGARGCEKIVSEALLQRLGVSINRFMHFVTAEEEEWFRVKDELLEAVNVGRYEEAKEYLIRYEEITEGKSELHSQFLLLMEAINEYYGATEVSYKELKENLEKAWEITKAGYSLDAVDMGRMSLVELCIKSFYLRLQEGECATETIKERYRALLRYIEKYVDERDQMRIYPEVAYRFLLLLDEQDDEAEEVYQTCKGILKNQGGLFMLSKLMEYRASSLKKRYAEVLPEDKKIEAEDAEQLAEVVRWLYEEYKVEQPKELLHILYGTEEIFRLSDVIKGRRIGMGLTQEQLSEGICDPVSISRIENGAVGPKTTILLKLMEKLKFPGGKASLSLSVGSEGAYKTAEKIRVVRKFSRYEELPPLVEEFKRGWKGDLFSEQYLMELESSTAHVLKKIDVETHEKNLWEAFHMTVPDKSCEELKRWAFTRTEAMLINMFSYVCEKLNKREEGIEWLRLLKEYYERQPLEKRHYIDGYELTLCNLGDLLGNQKKYEEAIRLEDIANREELKAGQGDGLRLTLYDKAWNMEQQWGSTYTKEESRPYMWAAFQLAKFYLKPERVNHVKSRWEKLYCEN